MITLAIDTSSARTSAALLWEDGRSDAASFERLTGKRGAEHLLFETVDELLRRHGLTPSEIGLWGVGIGPGSFAGIRAGIAAVQGLALPYGQPVKTVASFDAIAGAAVPMLPKDCQQICVLTDARRDEVYYALYNERGQRRGEVRIGALEELADAVGDPIWFVSPEIGRFFDDIKAVLGGFAVVADVPIYPDARLVARLARERFLADGQPDLEPVPLYLRPVQFKTV